MVLSTAYLGNIQYYSKLLSGRAVIDLGENYQKQSYRNRTEIMTPGGMFAMVIPVCTESGKKTAAGEVRIDNTKHWRHAHYGAIVSAYANSPYFFYYAERFEAVYREHHEFLADFNKALQDTVLESMNISPSIKYSCEHVEDISGDEDFRDSISPKARLRLPDPAFEPPVYYQVFSDRIPFAPNLSVIDLLFCEGPATERIIRNAICSLK